MVKAKAIGVAALILLVATLFSAQTGALQEGAATGTITGSVKSADGTAMEGVGVSARHQSQTWTTTVYTNRAGNFAFPALPPGQYRLWAQTVGFEAASADQALGGGGRVQQNFSLKTAPPEIVERQLSGSEWLASLPETTSQDQRMKQVFVAQCTGCHTASWVLQNRFDEKGWGIIIDMMSSGGLDFSTTGRNPLMQHYKKDLAAYLGNVRGPENAAVLRPLARPTGDATQVVITEYDLTRPDKPNYLQLHNGSDWSEGTPSRYEAAARTMSRSTRTAWCGLPTTRFPIGRRPGSIPAPARSTSTSCRI